MFVYHITNIKNPPRYENSSELRRIGKSTSYHPASQIVIIYLNTRPIAFHAIKQLVNYRLTKQTHHAPMYSCTRQWVRQSKANTPKTRKANIVKHIPIVLHMNHISIVYTNKPEIAAK